MSRIVIDRIDKKNNIAVIEIESSLISISTDLIPENAKEGDVLKLELANNTSIKSRIQLLEEKLYK